MAFKLYKLYEVPFKTSKTALSLEVKHGMDQSPQQQFFVLEILYLCLELLVLKLLMYDHDVCMSCIIVFYYALYF